MNGTSTQEIPPDVAAKFDDDDAASIEAELAAIGITSSMADPDLPRRQGARAAADEPTAGAASLPREIVARWISEGPLERQPTGFPTLDDLTRGGLVFGRRAYFVGAPGSGKTAMANFIGAEALRAGLVVGVLAIDEDPDDILTRHVQMLTGYAQRDCEERDPSMLADVAEKLSEFGDRLRFYDARTSIEEAAADVAEHAASIKARGLLIVDSIQTARATIERDDASDRERIENRVSAIRDCARNHRLIVIATSEMNRGGYASRVVAERANDLATAKGASAIEYSAQVLLALRSVPNESDLVHVMVAKNRGGRLGEFFLRLDRPRHELTECAGPDSSSDDPAADRAAERKERQLAAKAPDLVQIVLHNPGVGTRQLRAKAAKLGGRDLVDALVEYGLEAGLIVDRPFERGKVTDHHYFVPSAADAATEAP